LYNTYLRIGDKVTRLYIRSKAVTNRPGAPQRLRKYLGKCTNRITPAPINALLLCNIWGINANQHNDQKCKKTYLTMGFKWRTDVWNLENPSPSISRREPARPPRPYPPRPRIAWNGGKRPGSMATPPLYGVDNNTYLYDLSGVLHPSRPTYTFSHTICREYRPSFPVGSSPGGAQRPCGPSSNLPRGSRPCRGGEHGNSGLGPIRFHIQSTEMRKCRWSNWST